jgi:hypothetical protein
MEVLKINPVVELLKALEIVRGKQLANLHRVTIKIVRPDLLKEEK